MSKIKTIIKYLSLFVLTSTILFLIFVFISKLFLYKEGDFNIPKDFFDTINTHKDAESEDNGFEDLICFFYSLSNEPSSDFDKNSSCKPLNTNIQLGYFSILSRCIVGESMFMSGSIFLKDKCNKELDKNFYNNNAGYDKNINLSEISIDTKNELIEQNFKKFKNFVKINEFKYKKLNKKEFIKMTDDYLYIKKFNTKYIDINGFINYTRAIRYIAQDYFNKGEYNKGFSVVLKHQNFIDNILNKSDFGIMTNLGLMTANRINLNFIFDSIYRFELNESIKKDVYNKLNNKVTYGFIDSGLKLESNYLKNYYFLLKQEYLTDDNFNGIFDFYYGKIYTYLFFSTDETAVLREKQLFDIIKSKGKSIKYDFGYNINNMKGRYLISEDNYHPIYINQYKKEEDMIELRESILEKLK